MFSRLSNYIWSTGSDDQTVPGRCDDINLLERGEDEWILVDFANEKTKNHSDEPARVDEGITQIPAQRNLDILEESWYVTPPSCFDASQDNSLSLQTSPLENLLIEHPSMSVYGGDLTDAWVAVTQSFTAEETPENDQVSSISSTTTLEPRSHTHRRAVRSLDKAQKLSRHVQKNVLEQAKKQYKKKKLQAHNQTYAHVTRSRRKQKKLDRKQGKPSTVYSHRGC